MSRTVLPGWAFSLMFGFSGWAFAQTPTFSLGAPALDERMAEYVERVLASGPEQGRWSDEVQEFYEYRGHQPAWMSVEGRHAARALIDAMANADAFALPADRYPVDRLQTLAHGTPETLEEAFRNDVELSEGLLAFARDIAHGIGDDPGGRMVNVAHRLQDARDAASARDVLRRLEPVHAPYHQLRRAFEDYRARAAAHDEGWEPIPEGDLLRPEDPENDSPIEYSLESARLIAAVCARLVASGEYSRDAMDGPEDGGRACGAGPGGEPRYTPALEDAVRAFQARHGLLVDGIVGPQTIRAMNVSTADRALQIAVNMNRWRKLPDDLGWRHVHVNIPAFRLEAVEDGRAALEMAVVTGEPDWPTPVMRDSISYLEFSPYWNVPASITRRTIWPQIQRNPSYLRQQGFEVVRGWGEPAEIVDPASVDWSSPDDFPYRLRQRPGPHNAMGLVKFMFPNDDAIYLHDTPAEHRFEERRRAFSHGCVRVEDPVSLSMFLLRDTGWSEGDVRATMHGGERRVVHLDDPVPVYLSYFTAWVDGGRVQFREDVYGLDAEEARLFDVN